MIILDLETDGLYNECTKIHCAVAYNTDTNEFHEFTPSNIDTLPSFLSTVKTLSCHNGIGFDLKVLKKIYNFEYKGKYVDTLLVSRILWPDLEPAAYRDDATAKLVTSRYPHSVEAWGIRFGISKPEHEDWSTFTPEMLHRCKEDCKIQTQLYLHIQKHIKESTARDSRIANKWDKIIAMEQKVWATMEASADRGWQFDLQLAYQLIDELSLKLTHIEDELMPVLPKRTVRVTKNGDGSTQAFKKDGTLTKAADDWFNGRKFDTNDLKGEFCKVIFEDFNIGSSDQVKNYLLKNGWEPKEWNYKKDKHNKPLRDTYGNMIKMSPKVPKGAEEWEELAESVGKPGIALLAERNKAAHRRSQIQGLIDNVRLDHRIEAQANTCSTNTARMTHRIVVNIPKADPKVYYGTQMRSLFIASDDKVLVGADASALEARCEAHYVYPYDKAAALELLEGDIHTLNAGIFQVTRNVAKNGKYAILYGCSPAKLAATIGKPIAMAKQIYDDYWNGNPALKELKEDLENEFKEYGYLVGIDGRPLTIRYKHAIINTLFQSCGAIAVKIALCVQEKELKRLGLDAPLLGVFHDEMQRECKPSVADQVGQLMVQSLQTAGEYLKLNVRLDGEYKVGLNWAQTH